MSKQDVPRLCGGTFFLQLLRMKKPSTKTQAEGLRGEKDAVNNQRVLEALIRFFEPGFNPTCDDTFKGDVSAYLACDKAQGTNLPFVKRYCNDEIQKFDSLIQSNYNAPLRLMEKFVKDFIYTGKDNNVYSPVCALLQTIIDDETIDDNQVFYMGDMITKEQLETTNNIKLECFLLGLWHFILVNRNNNKKGRETFLEWNRYEGRGKPWTYISDIGTEIEGLRITRSNGVKIESAKPWAYEDETIEEDTEEYVSVEDTSPVFVEYKQLFQQFIINPVINYFNGVPGSTQINVNEGTIIVGIPQQEIVPALPPKPQIDKEDYYHLVIGYEYKERTIIDKNRALSEYISEETKGFFTLNNTEDMSMMRVLIMPEINDQEHEQTAIVGIVSKVKTQDNGVVLYVDKTGSFPSSVVRDNMSLFGISHIFEFNRTHWTIKKINLKEAMEDAGAIYE